MSSFTTITTTTTDTTITPVAGWLTKMISLPFGRSRWISRFFVLLDSELRFYKDEHSDCASQILNLRKVCQVIPTRTTQHPFCFRLEPQQYNNTDIMMRPWIIECKSEIDMENWISAIQFRINKYNSSLSCSSTVTSPAILSPKTPSSSYPQQQQESTSVRVASTYSMVNNTSPEFYRIATLPLRCTNLTLNNDQDDDTEKESLLMRRKKNLAPIVTLQQQEEQQCYYASPPTTSSCCSSSCTSLSPTGAVLGTLISPSIIDRYSQYKQQVSDHVAAIQEQGEVPFNNNTRCESPSSPTYLMYKKKFHL